MSQLAAFFKGSDTQLGVFYPVHSLVAIFSDIGQARMARMKLREVGFSDEEVLATAGADLVELVHEESAKMGVLGYVMREFSRFLHTEAAYTDHDLMFARQGAAVLAVLCPDERTKCAAWHVIAPTAPLSARYYALSGIEHLAGET